MNRRHVLRLLCGVPYLGSVLAAVDATLTQLINTVTPEQASGLSALSDSDVTYFFHVPPYTLGTDKAVDYDNVRALTQDYYAASLKTLVDRAEKALHEGQKP